MARAIIGIVLLVVLGAWAHYSNPYPTLPEILENPQKFHGHRVGGFNEATVAKKTDQGFVLVSQGKELYVATDAQIADTGTYVSVAGTFRAPNRLAAEAVYFARGRRVKVLVSVLALVILLMFAPLALQVDKKHRALRLRETHHA